MVPTAVGDIGTTITTAVTGLDGAIVGVAGAALGIGVVVFGLKKAWGFFRSLVKG